MSVLVYAHRGASGIRPENTMPAFVEAVTMGADGIETDVHFLHGLAPRYPGLPEPWVLRGLLLVAGGAWALININSYPMVIDMTTANKIGTYTGLYYLFSSLAAVGGPLLLGGLIDLLNTIAKSGTLGYGSLFAFGFVSFALALLCMSRVRGGEATA